MSGLKSTSWTWQQSRAAAERARRERLAAEAARRQEAARQAAARRALEEATQRDVRRQAVALEPQASQLVTALHAASSQVDPASRNAFAADLAEARALAQQAGQLAQQAARLATLSGSELVERSLSAASPVFAELRPLVGKLEEALRRVDEIRFQEGPERQRELVERLGTLRRAVAAASCVTDEAAVRRWSGELNQLWAVLREGDYDRTRQGADRLDAVIAQEATRAAAQRSQHEERLAVLDALRDSCRQLGYRELNPDELEAAVEQDEATWRLVVDTRVKGRLTFFIESEQIRAESMIGVRGDTIVGDHCFAEFRRLEAELAAGHGLLTRFTSPIVDRPDAPTATAARLPTVAEHTMGRQQL